VEGRGGAWMGQQGGRGAGGMAAAAEAAEGAGEGESWGRKMARAAQGTAAIVAKAAQRMARSTTASTPFAVALTEEGEPSIGGKMDDITVLCGFVCADASDALDDLEEEE